MTTERRRWPLYLAALTLAWGCVAGGVEREPEPAATEPPLAGALDALAAGDYETASARLSELAALCTSGTEGRRAVLLLAAVSLDPRNPSASPEMAAGLAAHLLGLEPDPGERAVAETLYLLALDRGGSVEGRSPERTAARALAPRYDDCEGGGSGTGGETGVASLPEFPGVPLVEELGRLQATRDSLSMQLTDLEAELDRIRRLLRAGIVPDTTGRLP